MPAAAAMANRAAMRMYLNNFMTIFISDAKLLKNGQTMVEIQSKNIRELWKSPLARPFGLLNFH